MKTLLGHSSTWLVVLTAVSTAACTGRGFDTASQVAAKVNTEEISLQQIDHFLRRQDGLTPDQMPMASRQALEALVDTEVAVQAALDQRMDRDPAVVQALDAARREVLANAYAERLTQAVQAPQESEVKAYFNDNPALFANRRLYTLVDTALDAAPGELNALAPQVAASRSANDVALLLRQSGVRHFVRRLTVGAEALPMQALSAIAQLKETQSVLVDGPEGAHVYTLVDARPAPLNLEEARDSIENFLMAEKRRMVVAQQIKNLRMASHIEYRGRFAEPMSATALSRSPAALPTASVTGASALNAVALERGLSALSSISAK